MIAENQILFGGGWGFVRGEDGQMHLVYIPLWDPPKYSQLGKALLASFVIKQYLPAVRDEKVAESLRSIGKEMAHEVAKNFSSAFDYDDDNWCGTPYPHKFPGHGPVPGWPGWFDEVANEKATAITVGATIKTLGGVLNNQSLIDAGNAIMNEEVRYSEMAG